MNNLYDTLKTNYESSLRMIIFDKIKMNNPVIDTILSTILISLFGLLINYLTDALNKPKYKGILNGCLSIFFRKHKVILEGCKSHASSIYGVHTVSSMYSNRFKAIWHYIINNIDKTNTIYEIKEEYSNYVARNDDEKPNYKNDFFTISQTRSFEIDKHIFAQTSTVNDDVGENKHGHGAGKTTTITIQIYSYKYHISYLKNYIDNLTDQYLTSIKNNRLHKKFIYNLSKTTWADNENVLNCWEEYPLESSRTFKTMFFDGKKKIVEHIDYFLNNKPWYNDKGIPYTLGIGLHGPPGTGKTTFVKALANYTNRDIVTISLKLIKTKKQLSTFFFENTYNCNNEKGSKTFDNKIILFEDIDCIGDIILDRQRCKNKTKSASYEIIHNPATSVPNPHYTGSGMGAMSVPLHQNLLAEDSSLTLDDILNLWDGIRETPGRIIVISSNHYNELDPALIRPGRIDITHELSNASHSVISDVYIHLFGSNINAAKLKKVKENFYSPAELINIYVSHKSENEFMNRLLLNKKV
jgi:hypothetical protein